jgi:hypothetical protein
MPRRSASPTSGLSRRTALGSAGVLAAILGLNSRFDRAAAQEAPPDLAGHPLTGTWLAMANPAARPDDPQFPAPSLFAADGTVLLVFPATQIGPQGVVFNAPVMGVWEADGERRGHFTAVQLFSDANGASLGSITIDGYPEVSEDGQTFVDDNSKVMITIRDASGAVVDQILPTGAPAGRPVTAIRMGVGSPGFPEGIAAGTPTS